MKMEKENKNMKEKKSGKEKRVLVRALALSQIFSICLEIFAICFIMSMSFALSAESVSGGTTPSYTPGPVWRNGIGAYSEKQLTDDLKDSEPLNNDPEKKVNSGTTSALFTTTLEKDGPKYTYKSDEKWYDSNNDEVTKSNIISQLEKTPAAYEYAGSGAATTKFFKWKAGGAMDTITTGVEWGVYAFGIAKVLNEGLGMFMEDWGKDKQNALTAAFTAGAIVYKSTDMMLKGTKVESYGSIVLGALAAYFAFAAFYKDIKTHEESVEFKCMTWQAPRGGSDCTKCNDNPLKPCSEYRCKALGQTCKLINAGTGMEKCIDSSPNDVTSPGIKPDNSALTQGYQYSEVKPRPAGASTSGTSGMKITNPQSEKGCLRAFSAFTFGIITTEKDGKNQPGQCKIDYNHTKSFDDMGYFMGEENKFTEAHQQAISLPNTDTLNKSFPGVKNDGEYTLYIRCKDGNGNENKDEFAVRFCIDKTPDLSAPQIKSTSIPSNSAVLYKIDNLSINVYTNEPANCRWSRKDADYSNMENKMACDNRIEQMNAELLYTCTTTLTAIKDKQENDFFFRCQDTSPKNNTMAQSYAYKLIGTQPLTILSVSPANGTIGSSTTTAVVNLSVKTDNGYKNGESTCYYSLNGNDEENYIAMVETGGNSHTQPLDLAEGSYNVYFKCVDAGGNTEYKSTSFEVFIDKSAPMAIRAYNADSKIKILTNEESTCKYSTDSCNFDLSKGEGLEMLYPNSIEHYLEWKLGQTYYLKCSDNFNNQPEPTECTTVLKAFELPAEDI